MPDHLSDLKAVDGSDFLSDTKCYSIFLHPFYLLLIIYNSDQLISNKIYKNNGLPGCVFHIINIVLGLSTLFHHQKDSKLAYLASEQLK